MDGFIARLGDLVVVGRIRFPGNASEAGVPGFGRPDDPDRLAALAPRARFVCLKRLSKPRGYILGVFTWVALHEFANPFFEWDWRETHTPRTVRRRR